MMGHFNLPEDKSKVKVDKYFAMGPLAQSGLIPQGTKVWNKPKGITFVYGLLIGPGTGGGGGGTGSAILQNGATVTVSNGGYCYPSATPVTAAFT